MKLKQRTSSDRRASSRTRPRPLWLAVLLTALWTLFSAIELAPGAGAAGLDLGGTASKATSAVSNAVSTAAGAAPSVPAAPAPSPAPTPTPTPTPAAAQVVNSVVPVQSQATTPSPPPSAPAQEKAAAAPVGQVTPAAARTLDSVGSHLTTTSGGAPKPTNLVPSATLPKQPTEALSSGPGSAVGGIDRSLSHLPIAGSLPLAGSVIPAVSSVVPAVDRLVPAVGELTGAAAAIPGSLEKALAPVSGALPALLDPVVNNVVPRALAPIKAAIPALPGLGKLVPPLATVTNPVSHLPAIHLPTPATPSPGSGPAGSGVPGGGAGSPPPPPPSPRYHVWPGTPPNGGNGSDLSGLGRPGTANPEGFLATPANLRSVAGSDLLSAPIEPGNGPQDSPSAPLPAPPGTTSSPGGIGGTFFVPLAALMALVGLSAPAMMRRLRDAAALPAPAPFVCALERPG